MPEGPSIVILKEEVEAFTGKKVIDAEGTTKRLDPKIVKGLVVNKFETFGKQFLICFDGLTIRIHLLLFGSYRINERKAARAMLTLVFDTGEINFYNCSIKLFNEAPDHLFEWSADVMNKDWDPKGALTKLKQQPATLICDALLDQNIFAGVGNIIKNEVLFRAKVHPESLVGKIPAPVLKNIIDEASIYSFEFLHWKKEYTLRAHWLAHTRNTCPRDGNRLIKIYPGKTKRRTYFCTICQKLYN